MNSTFYPTKDYKPAMGKRLRTYRQLNNYTQENMAEILDISLKHYSEVERGITGLSIEKLIFLSERFDISLDYLLKGNSAEPSLPSPMSEIYQTCPDDRKPYFLELFKCVNYLIHGDMNHSHKKL
ncbi:MAG: helix-turn-helix transcriptional regulator [Lachnospiraceae bacterium]|nr:helix-turn-helix transcriptional regulator [Lachnospiraceae bacterium]